MTMKTKRRLAIGGGTTMCAALALLIAMRFSPEDEQQFTASAPKGAELMKSSKQNKIINTAVYARFFLIISETKV